MDLKGKTLLLMGGNAFSQSLRKYKEQEGFKIISVGKAPNGVVFDKLFTIDTQNVDELVHLVSEEHVDGIFVGASEVNIWPAIALAERTGIHFYTDKRLFTLLSRKRLFKNILVQNGLDVTPDYHVSRDNIETDSLEIKYPVIVKPVDGSGARGISVCQTPLELRDAYLLASQTSFIDDVMVEKYIQDMDDLFIHYTLVDGVYSLSCTFDRYLDYSQGGCTGMAVAYSYPSKYTHQYINKIDGKIKEMFKKVGLINGAINLQCLTDGERFLFYESGYRLGGEQMYFFTEKLSGINVFEMIVNQALTGKMADSADVLKKDNPLFSKPCLSLYVPLKPGTITVFDGVEAVRKLNGVLNVTEMCGVGTVIERSGSLSQVCLRMHLMRNSKEELNELLSEIYRVLVIKDENGYDMVMNRFRITNE